MSLISSNQNPAIKHLHKLVESTRYRRESGECVLDGIHLIDACLQAGQQPYRVYIAEGQSGHPEIVDLISRLQQPVVWVTDAVLARASELKTPSGILAIYRPVPARINKAQRMVWLDDVQDPGNVGSILRTAAASGVDAIYLSTGCADVWSPRVLRAAMGAHFVVNLYPNTDLLALSEQQACDLVVTSLEQSTSLYSAAYKLPVAWVFGNEGEGVKPVLQQRANYRIRIPMPGAIESLNVAAAAAICLFEDVRRRENSELQ